MDSVRSNPLVCEACQKEFSNVSNRNKHQRKFHDEDPTKVDQMKHIICPICTTEKNEEKFSFYNKLDEHLINLHGIQINVINFSFGNVKEFEAWRLEENRDVDYVCVRRQKNPNGDTALNYYCNRSHYRAFRSVTERKLQMKSGVEDLKLYLHQDVLERRKYSKLLLRISSDAQVARTKC